jgi:L-malate glycosyltransferase
MALRYNIKQDKISVIYNGVNTKRFKEISLVTKLSSKLKIAVIGRLEKEKGHEQLINSLLELDRGSYHLTIVGEGSLRRDLQALVISYGLSKYIKFIGHHDNISSIYSRNEVVIIPSISEGFGLVAVEAMAAGRVVIASDVDGLPEVIEHNTNGFLVNFENNIALKKQLSQLYKKPDKIAKITKKARLHAVKYFDISVMIKHYEKVYRQLV